MERKKRGKKRNNPYGIFSKKKEGDTLYINTFMHKNERRKKKITA